MTRPPADPAAIPRGLHRWPWLRLGLGLAVLVIVAGAAYGGWFLFLRPAGPAPVDLVALAPTSPSPASEGAKVPSASASGAAGQASVPGAPSLAAGSSTGSATTATLDGTWKVNTSIGSGAAGSFVGYRVQEQLAGIGAHTAVGRTSNVTGSFVLQGTTVTAATITANLTTLRSDEPLRDAQLVHRGLQTATYPTATFVLRKPIALGSIPPAGQVVTVTASGALTLHGQTRVVRIPLQVRLSGRVVAIAGSLPITFSEYGITPPTSFIALSVADHGTMELQLMFTHA